jgi:hypothetical protein
MIYATCMLAGVIFAAGLEIARALWRIARAIEKTKA